MSVARDVESYADQILQGDVSGLRPALVRALAGRIALRSQPALRLEAATTAAEVRRLVLAGHAGAIAALLAALRRPAHPSLPRRIAAVLAVDLNNWSAAPSAEAAAVAAAAATPADEAGAISWLQRALAAAAGGGAANTGDRIAVAAAGEDFRDFHSATLRTPISRLLARPLWSGALRPAAQPSIEYWRARLKALGLHTLDDEYRRLVDGTLPDADELNDALVAALDEAAPPTEDSEAADEAGARGARAARGRASLRARPAARRDVPSATGADTVPSAGAAGATSPGSFRVTMPGRGTVEVPGSLVSEEVLAPAVDAAQGSETAPEPALEPALAPPARESPGETAGAAPDLQAYADALGALITDPTTATPLVLAINGDPGSGKSTLAAMIRQRMAAQTGRPPFTCWFDAWAHDGGQLVHAFLATVSRGARAHGPFWRRLLAPLRRHPSPDPLAGFDDGLRARLASSIRQATGADSRFIVFVDHLDRCLPPRPAALLEAVHHLLMQPNVVTVVMADMTVLTASVELKYRDVIEHYERTASPAAGEAPRVAYCRGYLRKIIQLQFDLPTAAAARAPAFALRLPG